MTEQAPDGFASPAEDAEEPPASPEESPGSPARVSTGVSSVDRVVEELDDLDDRPLEEHVAAFERAHESLRSALDASPDDPA
jgi:hypothetical protein